VYNANIRNALKNKITEDAANKKGKVGTHSYSSQSAWWGVMASLLL
jgi:hypothetical protein